MSSQPPSEAASTLPKVDIKPLLARLWPLKPHKPVSADEIAEAISYFFTNQLSDTQAGSLLMCLHFTGLDRRADVLASCAATMRKAAAQIDAAELRSVVEKRGMKEGSYQGGVCDIVGTGGDSHNTFNISTTSSILASSLLLVAKHGNKASTSKSGSADLLNAMQPQAPHVSRVRPDTIAQLYSRTNYGFLFAPLFHPGMRFVAPIRRSLPWRTIFNLLGPLANPADVDDGSSSGSAPILEARLIGVARRDLGPVFADALDMVGAKKAMVVCGDEELDEISCAGPTLCWRLAEDSGNSGTVEHFTLSPADFGLPAHPLSTVSPGGEPSENAAILARILNGELADDDPILHFVLINTAALLVVSGICEADTSSMGHGDDGHVIQERGPSGGRWKEGVRRARWAVKSGEARRQWEQYVEATDGFNP